MRPKYVWCDGSLLIGRGRYIPYRKAGNVYRPSPRRRCPVCNRMLSAVTKGDDDFLPGFAPTYRIPRHKRRQKPSERQNFEMQSGKP